MNFPGFIVPISPKIKKPAIPAGFFLYYHQEFEGCISIIPQKKLHS